MLRSGSGLPAVLMVLAFVVLLWAPARGTGDSAAGQAVFSKRCVGCHGPTGAGNERMARRYNRDLNLLRDEVAHKSDATLLKAITDGNPPMPAFGKILNFGDISNALAYVRKLQEKK